MLRSIVRQCAAICILLAGLGILIPGQPVTAQNSALPPVVAVDPPPGITELPTDLMSALRTTEWRPAKLDGVLAEIWQDHATLTSPQSLASRYTSLHVVDQRFQVQIKVVPGADVAVTQLIHTLGGEVTGSSLDHQWLQAWIPPALLDALMAEPSVQYVRRPPMLEFLDMHNSVISSEALSAFNVTAWHRSGITGQGQRVGVIDGGFKDYLALRGQELPLEITGRNFADQEEAEAIEGPTAHGTAVAEIVYDVAPGADLYLARIATDIDLKEAVLWLIEQEVDVIVTAVGWYNLTPGDGTGYFADLAQLAQDAGILWVSAAGNDREHHWGGSFTDQDKDGYLDFKPGHEVNFFGPGNGQIYLIPAGVRLALHLRWSDWEEVREDYDVLLMRWNGWSWKPVAESRNPQEGIPGQTPTETLHFTTAGEATYYGFIVLRYRGDPTVQPHFEIFMPKFYRPDLATAARSLINLADVPAVLTVAAVDAMHPFETAKYSAEGPTNGPGGVAEGGLSKPDLAAYTNVTTASLEHQRFTGTSAAAPHVAGAALLLKDAFPDWTVHEIRRYLLEQALPLAPHHHRIGYGRLNLSTPPTNLATSFMEMAAAQVAERELVTVTIHLVNSERITSTVSVHNPLPSTLTVEGATASLGAPPVLAENRLTWSGSLPPAATAAIVYTGTLHATAQGRLINTVHLSEVTGASLTLSSTLNPVQVFMPSLHRVRAHSK